MAHNNNYASAGSGDLRLFTALWPDESTRQQIALHRNRQGWGDGARTVLETNLHVTLTFLGRVSRSVLPVLADRLAAVPCRPIELYFDRTDNWGDGLVVLYPRETPAALTQLQQRLQTVHQALGFPLESRPYRPHVTLARRAHGAVLMQPKVPIRWVAEGFVCVQSHPPGAYQILQDFRC